MLNQWAALTRFMEDAELELDNNASERAMRHVVLGRRNWTFAGSAKGGHRAATIYSIVATCHQHGLDPFAYLRDVIDASPGATTPPPSPPPPGKPSSSTAPKPPPDTPELGIFTHTARTHPV